MYAWLKKVMSSTPESSTARSFTSSSPRRMRLRVGSAATMASTQAVSPGTRSRIRRKVRRSS